ncbi:MAG: hypothetical protein ABIU09_13220 [Pyrinomonadaceae bacterium]
MAAGLAADFVAAFLAGAAFFAGAAFLDAGFAAVFFTAAFLAGAAFFAGAAFLAAGLAVDFVAAFLAGAAFFAAGFAGAFFFAVAIRILQSFLFLTAMSLTKKIKKQSIKCAQKCFFNLFFSFLQFIFF